MGSEDNVDGKVLGLKMIPRHKRSKSFPDKRRVENALDDSLGESPRLKLDQFAERRALENALGSGSSSYEANEPSTVPKPATELIKEIAVLELEVGYLEQYLLSLYRKAFDQQASTVSPTVKAHQASSTSPTIKNQKSSSISPTVKDRRLKSPPMIPRRLFVDEDAAETATKAEQVAAVQSVPKTFTNTLKEPNDSKTLDSNVHRCHSSLSHRTALATRPSPDAVAKALRACHSQPLSMTEFAASNVISLAEHLGTRISDHIPETPNRISEDMVKCMAAIFCKLGELPAANNGLSSPNSSSSSMGAFSPQYQCDAWSPSYGKDSSFDTRLDNPFNVEGLKEFSGPYSSMIEVQCLYRESQKLGDVEYMLQNFRSLISQLQEVDPKKLKHEEKLAFWINVHNALAFLAYGIPQNNVKRVFLLLKAAYNIGGQTISADTIQSSILGCRMSRPGQWLRMLLSPRTKFKAGDNRQAYVLEHPEPLLHFALCSGNHSDPALRVYTPKRVLQDLEGAKDEYIRATFGVRKDQKIVLPKIVESYAKDSSLCSASIIEMIQQSLPDSLKKSLKKCQTGKSRKSLEWMPHNFSFRYLISKEIVK
ncbi:Quinohemoprotein alcohol dehydrogenase ADH-IIG [Bienertia sinuspersici]